MKLSEMGTKMTPQKINKLTESRFGFSVDYKHLTTAKAQRLSKAISENIQAIRRSFGGHTAQENPKYAELLLVKEGIDAWMRQKSYLSESEMGKSEAVLAAKDIVDSIQGMLEKISKIQNEQVPALIDTIRDQIGSEQADQFKSSISPTLTELYTALSTARESSDTSVRVLSGEKIGDDQMHLGDESDDGSDDSDEFGRDEESDFDHDEEEDDGFSATDSAAGGREELGRARR